MSVLIKIILDLEETEQRDTDAVLDGREAMPENGTCPEPHRNWPNSAGISQMLKKIKNQKKSGQYNLQDLQNNMWMSGCLEPQH